MMFSELAPNPSQVHFTLPPEATFARPDLVIADQLGPIVMRRLGATGLQVFCSHPGPEVDWNGLVALDNNLHSYGLSVPAKEELHKRGVTTPRDVLVVGSDILRDFDHVGPKMIDRLGRGIQARFPVLRLLCNPTPGYATVFCRDLSEVPLAAVYDRNMQPGPRVSLQDVLARTSEARSRFLSSETFDRIFARTMKFAGEFNMEKTKRRY